MSYILTTVYAAEGGESAARYAAGLADALNIPLRIIYPFTVPVTIGEMPMPMMPVEELRDAAHTRLATVCGNLKSAYPSLSLSSDATYGIFADILDDADLPRPLLTVISNEDAEDSDSWMGSESASILREGRLPVLAVPRAAAFRRPQHVCLACDARSIREGLPLGVLTALRGMLDLRITVLHVVGSSGEEVASYERSVLETQLSGTSAGYAEIAAAAEVDEAIAAFADRHNIDWLALAPHHYGFWEGIFHKSHTSRLLHLAHVPVLALHEA